MHSKSATTSDFCCEQQHLSVNLILVPACHHIPWALPKASSDSPWAPWLSNGIKSTAITEEVRAILFVILKSPDLASRFNFLLNLDICFAWFVLQQVIISLAFMQTLKNANIAGLFTDYLWTEVCFTTPSTGSICLHDSKLNKSTIFIVGIEGSFSFNEKWTTLNLQRIMGNESILFHWVLKLGHFTLYISGYPSGYLEGAPCTCQGRLSNWSRSFGSYHPLSDWTRFL